MQRQAGRWYLLRPTFLLTLSPFRSTDFFAGAGSCYCGNFGPAYGYKVPWGRFPGDGLVFYGAAVLPDGSALISAPVCEAGSVHNSIAVFGAGHVNTSVFEFRGFAARGSATDRDAELRRMARQAAAATSATRHAATPASSQMKCSSSTLLKSSSGNGSDHGRSDLDSDLQKCGPARWRRPRDGGRHLAPLAALRLTDGPVVRRDSRRRVRVESRREAGAKRADILGA